MSLSQQITLLNPHMTSNQAKDSAVSSQRVSYLSSLTRPMHNHVN